MMKSRYHETYTLPFKEIIPSNISQYIRSAKNISRRIKFLRRICIMFLFREMRNERQTIKASDKKILWINISAPSIGDSLMDLSSRSIIENKEIDLLTDSKNSHIYHEDEYFRNIYDERIDLKNLNYDLIILDSYSSRSLKIKHKYFPNTKFVSLYGFFNGPEINRIYFSFYKMKYLLNQPLDLTKNSFLPSISLPDSKLLEKLPNKTIVIAIGGEWGYRTYDSWEYIVEFLLKKTKLNVALVGSSNGVKHAQKILNYVNSQRAISFVNQLKFKESVKIIGDCDYFIGCDGGLLYAAAAMNKKMLALFAELNPLLRITDSMNIISLYDKDNVNNISLKEIKKSINSLLNG